jgi:hypothetical protein
MMSKRCSSGKVVYQSYEFALMALQELSIQRMSTVKAVYRCNICKNFSSYER